MVDISFSQNFYINENHLKQMIRQAGFKSNDTILDIGAGEGLITKELTSYSNHVIAYELDTYFFERLSRNLENFNQVKLLNLDFLSSTLPNIPFKLFSNIPFAMTSDIISKITDISSLLLDAYIFVQVEAAERFTGFPQNTQISTILNYKYDITIIEELDRRDFRPMPSVDIVLLHISKKEKEGKDFLIFRDFVSYIFNQTNKSVLDTFDKLFTQNQIKYIRNYLKKNYYNIPSEIPFRYYFEIFNIFLTNGDNYKKKIVGYFDNYTKQHSKREKVNRTRREY